MGATGAAGTPGAVGATGTAGAPGGTGPAGPGVTWVDQTGPSVQMVSNVGYLSDDAAQVALTLPTNPAIGDLVAVTGVGVGGFKIVQNAGQQVYAGFENALWVPRGALLSWNSVASSADGSHVVASVFSGQIYTSSDSGTTWTVQNTIVTNWGPVASSANGAKLMAAEASGLIYLSADYGLTWAPQSPPAGNWIGVASSADGTKLFALGSSAVYVSLNAGATWSLVTPPTAENWYSIAASTDGSKVIVAGLGFNPTLRGDIYVSSNSGGNWTLGFTNGSISQRTVASSADGSKLFAAGSGAMEKSTDSGATWAGVIVGEGGLGLAVSADGSTIFNSGASTVSMSMDTGATWTQLSSTAPPVTKLAVSSDGRHLFGIVNGGYLYNPSATTTLGTAGKLSGTQHQSLTLQYVGDG